MAKISMENGYFIETFDDGYKLLRIGIDKFKKMCKE